MTRPDWVPAEIDIDKPSPARIYDYFLGGSHNFAVDRALGEQFIAAAPDTVAMSRANRAFLRRAVRVLADAGVRQFLDLGSGIPTAGNVHEIVQQVAPDARVVYVDVDPVAVAHSKAILAGDPRTVAVRADLRQPATVLDRPDVAGLLDLDEPVAVLLVSVLHFVPDSDHPAEVVAGYADQLAAGSHLVISHLTHEANPEYHATGQRLSRPTGMPATTRTRDEVARLFTGFDLIAPGLVWAPLWRPDPGDAVTEHPERSGILTGVGRKP